MTHEEAYAAGVRALIARDHAAALPIFVRLASETPVDADIWCKLGQTLWMADEQPGRERALQVWREAVALDPTSADAQTLYGGGLGAFGLYEKSLEHLARAIDIAPGHPIAHAVRGYSLLALGHLREGLSESRFEFVTHARKPRTMLPEFTGVEPSVLVWGEQGSGDQLFYARWGMAFHETSPSAVCIEVYKSVYRLIAAQERRNEAGERMNVVARPDDAHMPWGCESALPMMECPLWLPGELDCGPWLRAPGIKTYPKDAKTVGFVWRGNPDMHDDKHRSLTLEQVEPIMMAAQEAGYKVVSFQVPLRVDEIERLTALGIEDWGQTFADFACTADAMMSLDHLVSVSTACAILAGGLGVPSRVLLPRPCDWRWYTRGERADTSPWIPLSRLYWQDEPGQWGPPLERARSEYASA